jgi:hypothetical protein
MCGHHEMLYKIPPFLKKQPIENKSNMGISRKISVLESTLVLSSYFFSRG